MEKPWEFWNEQNGQFDFERMCEFLKSHSNKTFLQNPNEEEKRQEYIELGGDLIENLRLDVDSLKEVQNKFYEQDLTEQKYLKNIMMSVKNFVVYGKEFFPPGRDFYEKFSDFDGRLVDLSAHNIQFRIRHFYSKIFEFREFTQDLQKRGKPIYVKKCEQIIRNSFLIFKDIDEYFEQLSKIRFIYRPPNNLSRTFEFHFIDILFFLKKYAELNWDAFISFEGEFLTSSRLRFIRFYFFPRDLRNLRNLSEQNIFLFIKNMCTMQEDKKSIIRAIQNLCDEKLNERDLADLKRTVQIMNRKRKRGEI
jgi:hypothetical protein